MVEQFEEVEVEVTEEDEEGEDDDDAYEEVEYEEEEEEDDDDTEEDATAPQEEAAKPTEPAPVLPPPASPQGTTAPLPVSETVKAGSEPSGSPAPASAVAETAEDSPVPTANGTSASSMLADNLESFKGLEAKTTKAAAEAAEQLSKAAFDYSSKLSSAFSAVSAAEAVPLKDAQESVSKLVGGFTSWWNNMDKPSSQEKGVDELESKVTAASKASSELQKLFELPDHENLVEEFKCKLLQTYSCAHNSVTPAIQMAFQGTLYITDRHTCFTVEERGRKLPFKVLHAEVSTVQRQRPTRKGDPSDVLYLQLGTDEKWMSFKDFASGSDLDSALALLEHLTTDE
eukprot:CAMPEP_0117677150 /NCGR_PEP_ID=MMETSP0804-20121206/16590_1 /TAXON_ID=1074897 /ORGANISM="Tetraselmis astigmatica, Strain CCMP880" /LENGTH=342 /DNA_ID=CAMNT_0005486411 /DNA_START=125 /DNA_END=1153 /DNA_ORIENTATION=+